MTSHQISTIATVINVALACNYYRETENEIVATWKADNHPVYDDLVDLRKEVVRCGGAMFISHTEDDEYKVTIDKVALVA
jgi:hypothetical protein